MSKIEEGCIIITKNSSHFDSRNAITLVISIKENYGTADDFIVETKNLRSGKKSVQSMYFLEDFVRKFHSKVIKANPLLLALYE